MTWNAAHDKWCDQLDELFPKSKVELSTKDFAFLLGVEPKTILNRAARNEFPWAREIPLPSGRVRRMYQRPEVINHMVGLELSKNY